MPTSKPEPVIVRTICSLCDEPWESHGDKPTTLDCIRLLKARTRYPWPTTQTIVYPTVLPQPLIPVRPYQPWYGSQTICGTTTQGMMVSNAAGAQTSTTEGIPVSTVYKTPVTA